VAESGKRVFCLWNSCALSNFNRKESKSEAHGSAANTIDDISERAMQDAMSLCIEPLRMNSPDLRGFIAQRLVEWVMRHVNKLAL
jgi:hypothetical protein